MVMFFKGICCNPLCYAYLTVSRKSILQTKLSQSKAVSFHCKGHQSTTTTSTTTQQQLDHQPHQLHRYHNGKQLVSSNENSNSHRMILPSGQLFFMGVNSRLDVGTYYCNATNPLTGVSAVSHNTTLENAGGSFLVDLTNVRY